MFDSLGLHEDTTLEEFTELMSKCGIIMEDPDTSESIETLRQSTIDRNDL